MTKIIYVYENWSSETPVKLGLLYLDQGGAVSIMHLSMMKHS